jgi:hypothetical protein
MRTMTSLPASIAEAAPPDFFDAGLHDGVRAVIVEGIRKIVEVQVGEPGGDLACGVELGGKRVGRATRGARESGPASLESSRRDTRQSQRPCGSKGPRQR